MLLLKWMIDVQSMPMADGVEEWIFALIEKVEEYEKRHPFSSKDACHER